MDASSKRIIGILGAMNIGLLCLGFTQWAGNWVDLRAAAQKAPAPMAFPNTFTYQGKLTKPDGSAHPDGSDYFMDFELYDSGDPSVTTPICHWAVQGIVVKQGNFRAVIGSTGNGSDGTCKGANAITNVMALYPDIYLGIKVRKGSGALETMDPRVHIGSTPRAQHAAVAEVAKTSLDGVPVGAVSPYFGLTTAVPQGWLVADGSKISKSVKPEYTSLVVHLQSLGAPYATGNPDEANLPDLRGVFLRGQNLARSDEYSNPESKSLGQSQLDSMVAHNHASASLSSQNGSLAFTGSGSGTTANSGSHTHALAFAGSGAQGGTITHGWGAVTWQSDHTQAAGDHSHTFSVGIQGTALIYSNGGAETRPKNVTVLYIIKY